MPLNVGEVQALHDWFQSVCHHRRYIRVDDHDPDGTIVHLQMHDEKCLFLEMRNEGSKTMASSVEIDLNLTSCNSRPAGGGKEEMWQYVFFLEFEHERQGEGGNVEKALEELKQYTKGLRLVGSWESQLRDEA